MQLPAAEQKSRLLHRPASAGEDPLLGDLPPVRPCCAIVLPLRRVESLPQAVESEVGELLGYRIELLGDVDGAGMGHSTILA